MLIPLEFHRGLGDQCLKGWTMEQTLRSDEYEVILAAPSSFDPAELDRLRGFLRPWDQVMALPVSHDMDLVASAAKAAKGATLVFTESHCLPQPDFLQQCDATASGHPEWAAFSGKSVPITHNLLSEIESAMYVRDIEAALENHPWRKVLDQCFVIQREAYFVCGGLEVEYGHFAEWVLAVRLKAHALTVGFAAEVAVRHYYIGDLEELVEFAEDFGAGQMRFAIHCERAGESFPFETPAKWEDRFSTSRREAWSIVKMLLASRHLQAGGWRTGQWERLLEWAATCLGGIRLQLRRQRARVEQLRAETTDALERNHSSAHKLYLHLNDAATELGQLEAWAEHLKSDSRQGRGTLLALERRSGAWVPGKAGAARQAGFHACENLGGEPLVWTRPEASIWLPLAAGTYLITFQWFEVAPWFHQLPVTLFVNGAPLRDGLVQPTSNILQFKLSVTGSGGARLGWVVAEFTSKGDSRCLGLPLRRIKWKRDFGGVGVSNLITNSEGKEGTW